jgi:hypothetical protein
MKLTEANLVLESVIKPECTVLVSAGAQHEIILVYTRVPTDG